MDPISHTVIAVLTVAVAYYIGRFFGRQQGNIESTMMMMEWIQSRIGMAEWNRWRRELDIEAKKEAND